MRSHTCMKAASWAWLSVVGCAAASPAVQVSLRTSWPKVPLLLEAMYVYTLLFQCHLVLTDSQRIGVGRGPISFLSVTRRARKLRLVAGAEYPVARSYTSSNITNSNIARLFTGSGRIFFCRASDRPARSCAESPSILPILCGPA